MHGETKKRGEMQGKSPMNEQMFTSMSDIGFSRHLNLIPKDLRDKMTDVNNNWKIRTETIDEIMQIIDDKIGNDPVTVANQTEVLLEFFISLLGDQNFKIILTTLSIISTQANSY